MYRWQSPAPPAVVAYRTRRALRNLAHEGRAIHEQDLAPAQPSVPSMTVDGVEYVEAPEISMSCDGCAAEDDANLCTRLCKASYLVLGHDCAHSERIYLRKG